MAESLGPRAISSGFDSSDLTSDLENNVDDEKIIEVNTDEVPEVLASPEFNDQYLNVDLMLPCVGE